MGLLGDPSGSEGASRPSSKACGSEMEICLTTRGVWGPEGVLGVGGGLQDSCKALREEVFKSLRSWSQSSSSPNSLGRGASSEETAWASGAFSSPALGALGRV